MSKLRSECEAILVMMEEYREMGRDLPVTGVGNVVDLLAAALAINEDRSQRCGPAG